MESHSSGQQSSSVKLATTEISCHCIKGLDQKLFTYSTQLNMKIIMLINVKMPTIVVILIFISMNKYNMQEVFIFQYFSFHEHLEFHYVLS